MFTKKPGGVYALDRASLADLIPHSSLTLNQEDLIEAIQREFKAKGVSFSRETGKIQCALKCKTSTHPVEWIKFQEIEYKKVRIQVGDHIHFSWDILVTAVIGYGEEYEQSFLYQEIPKKELNFPEYINTYANNDTTTTTFS